jgi:plasmid maintenance system antidote protein VapI
MSRTKVNRSAGKRNKAVSTRLRKLIKERFGTQVELARALDVKPQTLTKYTSGEYLPGNTIQAKLRELGVDVEHLMTGKRNESHPHSLLLDRKTSREIGAVLKAKFLVHREFDMKSVANQLGLHADQLEAFVSGKEAMPVGALVRIASVTRDLSFVEPLFKGSPIRLTLIPPETKKKEG